MYTEVQAPGKWREQRLDAKKWQAIGVTACLINQNMFKLFTALMIACAKYVCPLA
jgi:hypothetical protein